MERIQKAKMLHHNILAFKHPGLLQYSPKTFLTKTEATEPPPKMLQYCHSPSVFEFQFNNPKALNVL